MGVAAGEGDEGDPLDPYLLDRSLRRSEVDRFLRQIKDNSSLLWRVAVTLGFIAFALFISLVAMWMALRDATEEVIVNREAGAMTRSALCLTVLLDSDRTFEMPDFCTEPIVAQHYPPNVCGLMDDPPRCGTESDGP